MRPSFRAILPVLLLWATGVGCKKSDDVEPPPDPAPVTAEDARALAASLETALDRCDQPELERLLDVDAILREAISRTDATPRQRRGILEGARQGGSLSRQLCEPPAGGTHTFLRLRGGEDDTRALFRVVSAEGVNYYEFDLGSTEEGKTRAHDMYIYLSGERLTDTLANTLDTMLASMSTAREAENLNAVMGRIRMLLAAERHDAAAEKLAAMQASIRDSKPFRLLEITITAGQSDADYAEAIERYQRDFPDDPSLDLVAIDGHYMRGDLDAAYEAIARLERRLGGDPYLSAMRASIHLEQGDPDAARELAGEALEAEPDLEMPQWVLMNTAIHSGDHDAALERMRILRDRFDADVTESMLVNDPEFQQTEQWKAFVRETRPR